MTGRYDHFQIDSIHPPMRRNLHPVIPPTVDESEAERRAILRGIRNGLLIVTPFWVVFLMVLLTQLRWGL